MAGIYEAERRLKMDLDKFKQALQADFNALYQEKYTTSWEAQRLIRSIEIDIMKFENVKKYIKECSK